MSGLRNLVLVWVTALLCVGENVKVGQVAALEPAGHRWYPDYQIHADPTNPRNLMICGGRWNTASNVLSGFVYASSDGGRLWTQSLEDESSTFVSEHSCAFGADGKAYFLSAASKVIDGVLHHNLGTTRIFTSADHGRTWTRAVRTGWADSPISVVGTGGPVRDRLVTFFNDSDWRKSKLTRVGLMTFRASEHRVMREIPHWREVPYEYRGSFPHKAIVLKDHSIVALYRATLNTSDPIELAIGVVRLSPGHKDLPKPVHAVHVVLNKEHPCFIDEADAYDPSRDRIWIAYHDFVDGRCKFLLTASSDHGLTWSEPTEVSEPATTSREYHNPAMEFNLRGVLGLLWRDSESSDCWYFAASDDQGRTFRAPDPLSSACSPSQAKPHPDAFLMAEVTQGGSSRSSFGPTLSVINHLNSVWQFASPLVATADGLFHPVWIEGATGQGELKTAAISVDHFLDPARPIVSAVKPSSLDVSDEVALLYRGDQHYDTERGMFTIKMVLRNKTNKRIFGPISLQAVAINSELGPVEVLNSDNGERRAGAIWDLSDALPRGVLEPFRTTRPFSLNFQLSPANRSHQMRPFELVGVQLKVLAQKNAEKNKVPPRRE